MTLRSLFLFLLVAFTAVPSHAAVEFFSTHSIGNVPAQECRDASAIVTPLIKQFNGPSN
jgi:hypothetical protein